MAKMEAATLLKLLQGLEEDSAQFNWGTLAQERREAAREFYRQPYGNETRGWSSIVTSEVQDTIEWMMPDLLDMFTSSDRAVEFEPSKASDVKGAEESTDACNHVFYTQNNGFMVLYTAFKDALMFKNAAVHWRKETRRTVTKIPFKVRELVELALLYKEGDEFSSAEEVEEPATTPDGQVMVDPMTGQPIMQKVLVGTMTRSENRTTVKVEAFDPENLLVQRDWTSPLLEECPYVARMLEVTLSQVNELAEAMGFDEVTAEELAASTLPSTGDSIEARHRRRGLDDDVGGDTRSNEVDSEDESLTRGYLRIEWVLADVDGDGIAERREIYRLHDKILSNEECPEVPIATGSPIGVQHRWDGMSIAEMMSDLQKLKTELTRGVVNNAYSSNNPRKQLLVDNNGAPQADVDDLLNDSPGGILRVKRPDALTMEQTAFTGNQMFPLLEYVDTMGEKRTGVNKSQQGQDPNALRQDRTAQEAMLLNNAAAKRIKLIARMLAETILRPTFRGIQRLLTEGGMDKLAFMLRGEFVELDPSEWRDGYDMKVNVGLGTGDTDRQIAQLDMIFRDQMGLATSPLGQMFVTPGQLYNTKSKQITLRGFKNVGDFLSKPPPDAKLPSPPPPPPDPSIQVATIRAQADMQKAQMDAQLEAQRVAFEQQAKEREQNNQQTLQQSNDERDADRARMQATFDAQLAGMKLALDRYTVDANNRTKLLVARLTHPEAGIPADIEMNMDTGEIFEKPDPIVDLSAKLDAFMANQKAPKVIIRDPATGKAIGVQQGAEVSEIVRGPDGRVAGAAPIQQPQEPMQ